MCPGDRVAQLFTPRHWVYLLVTSYDMQGYGGIILLRRYTEIKSIYVGDIVRMRFICNLKETIYTLKKHEAE
jgi:hypothetical protein